MEPNLSALTITMPGTNVTVPLRHTLCEQKVSDVYFSQPTLHEVILKSNVNLYTNAPMMFIVQTIFAKKQNKTNYNNTYLHANMSPWPIAVCVYTFISKLNWRWDCLPQQVSGTKNNALFRENASNSLPLEAISNSLT